MGQNLKKIFSYILHPTILPFLFHSIILFFSTNPVYGQWSADPNENLEVNPWGVFVTACSDGEGGAYIGWKNFDYDHTRAYLQYVDKYGYIQWDEPLMILDKGDLQKEPFLLEDGEGNCIVSVLVSNIIEILPGGTKLLDYTNYIQKINKNGELLWDTSGVRLTVNERDQYEPSLVTDKRGGALFCWYEAIINNDESSFARYYTQHIQSNGIRTWSDTGKVIMDSLTQPLIPMAVSDGAGGMIVYYGDDFQQVNNTYFERIDFLGNSLWKRASNMIYTNMIGLGNNGTAINGYTELHEAGMVNINANILRTDGTFLVEDGNIVLADTIPQVYWGGYSIYDDEFERIIFNYYNENDSSYYYQIMELTGDLWYEIPGEVAPGIIAVKSDSSFIFKYKITEGNNKYTYLSRIDYSGNNLWDEGKLITTKNVTRYSHITDMKGGYIFVFSESEPWGTIRAQQINKNGELGIVTKVEKEEENVANRIELLQNYPNPFNPSTKIKFFLEKNEYAELTVYNLLGEKITTLFEDYAEPGTKIVTWDGTDSRGKKQASGVYIVTLKIGKNQESIKTLLIK